MEFQFSPEKIIPYEYDLFVGLDVDKKSISVTEMDHYGRQRSLRMPNQASNLIGYLRRQHQGKRIVLVYEAGPTGYGLYDQLTAAGYTCMVTAPSNMPQQPGPKVKTNRLDSIKLVTRLKGGELEGIRVPSPLYRGLRHLTHQWSNLARDKSRIKCQIKALLLMEGLDFPDPKGQYIQDTLEKLVKGGYPEPVQGIIGLLTERLIYLHGQQLQLGRKIRHYCASEEQLAADLNYVTSIPGIAWKAGAQVLARIGDSCQLKNTTELAGLVGLGQRENSTGTKVKKGGITRKGDRRLRNVLVEAAWAAIRKDSELRRAFERISQQNPQAGGRRKAIVAVARKMTERIVSVLKNQRRYKIRKLAEDAGATGAATPKASYEKVTTKNQNHKGGAL